MQSVNADDQKPQNHKKSNVKYNNIAWMSMLLWLTLRFYAFLQFMIRRH